MTDAKQPESPSELPELPDTAEMEALPELPDAAEALPDLPDEIVPVAAETPKATPAPAKPKAAAPKPASKPKSAPVKPKPVKPAPVTPVAKPAPKPEPKPAPKPEPVAAPAATLEPVAAAAPHGGAEDANKEPASSTPEQPMTPGEKPPLRVLDKAPAHLRKAAMVVAVGCLVPWMGHGGGWMTSVLAKLVVLGGAWFWLKQIDHNWGPPLQGFLAKLAGLELKPKKKAAEEEEKKPRRRQPEAAPSALEHPFPTGLHLLSLVLVLVGCIVIPLQDASSKNGPGIAELGMLAWAAYTFVHIHSYERWGSFNPLFPLMFLGMLIGGISRTIFAFREGFSEMTGTFGVLGGAVVAIGGGIAAYTIVEAMMAAKKEGDIKKQAQIEARKQAREARKKK